MEKMEPLFDKTQKWIFNQPYDWGDFVYVLRIKLNDLEKNFWYVNYSKQQFEIQYRKFQLSYQQAEEGFNTHMMRSYFYFESYLYFLKTLLDNLSKFIEKLYSKNINMPSNTFNRQMSWLKDPKKNNRFEDSEYIRYIENNVNWFKMLKGYRDEFTHKRGFNQTVITNLDKTFDLDMCGSLTHNRYHYNINEIIVKIHKGFYKYIRFCDDNWHKKIIEKDTSINPSLYINQIEDIICNGKN